MKRQKYAILDDQDIVVSMQKLPQAKLEKTLEAQVQDGDTLQALSLRYYCTVAEIKRLNKIDKDNEIFARKIIKVPITPHSILLETAHKSGDTSSDDGNSIDDDHLKVNKIYENSQVASTDDLIQNQQNSINNIILNSKLKYNNYIDDHGGGNNRFEDLSEPFINGVLDETIPQPRMLKGPSTSDVFDCSGSDCDMSWICLFVFILALCFAIPLIYVLYIAEHLEKYHHNSL